MRQLENFRKYEPGSLAERREASGKSRSSRQWCPRLQALDNNIQTILNIFYTYVQVYVYSCFIMRVYAYMMCINLFYTYVNPLPLLHSLIGTGERDGLSLPRKPWAAALHTVGTHAVTWREVYYEVSKPFKLFRHGLLNFTAFYPPSLFSANILGASWHRNSPCWPRARPDPRIKKGLRLSPKP